MREIKARQNDSVFGVGEFDFHHPHDSVKQGWLRYVRSGKKVVPTREDVEWAEETWESDIFMADMVWEWLNNQDAAMVAGEDLLAKRLSAEYEESRKTTSVSDLDADHD